MPNVEGLYVATGFSGNDFLRTAPPQPLSASAYLPPATPRMSR
ncbi:MAG TPA: hypothetical protein VMW62_13820 [Chloroflexota bacterium]|nr:hypothetical protein [Chloroflexota bacterium]